MRCTTSVFGSVLCQMIRAIRLFASADHLNEAATFLNPFGLRVSAAVQAQSLSLSNVHDVTSSHRIAPNTAISRFGLWIVSFWTCGSWFDLLGQITRMAAKQDINSVA
ncbi:hypothetical protein BD410DRAFT_146483 [Rickenella mellea]|uniref:Uncharacterized protein n=1 Tax=Rickenella mellea TaxID=50990 RepID=A0A4Y7Q8N5_9AGAM|nr:hypothetical protein BD410DRAFT_146483 [Rickenella mellea]